MDISKNEIKIFLTSMLIIQEEQKFNKGKFDDMFSVTLFLLKFSMNGYFDLLIIFM